MAIPLDRCSCIRGDQSRDLAVPWLLSSGENHPSVSIVAQCPVLLPELSAVGELIHALGAEAVGKSLPDNLHRCQSNLLLPNDVFIALVEFCGLSVRHGSRWNLARSRY